MLRKIASGETNGNAIVGMAKNERKVAIGRQRGQWASPAVERPAEREWNTQRAVATGEDLKSQRRRYTPSKAVDETAKSH